MTARALTLALLVAITLLAAASSLAWGGRRLARWEASDA